MKYFDINITDIEPLYASRIHWCERRERRVVSGDQHVRARYKRTCKTIDTSLITRHAIFRDSVKQDHHHHQILYNTANSCNTPHQIYTGLITRKHENFTSLCVITSSWSLVRNIYLCHMSCAFEFLMLRNQMKRYFPRRLFVSGESPWLWNHV